MYLQTAHHRVLRMWIPSLRKSACVCVCMRVCARVRTLEQPALAPSLVRGKCRELRSDEGLMRGDELLVWSGWRRVTRLSFWKMDENISLRICRERQKHKIGNIETYVKQSASSPKAIRLSKNSRQADFHSHVFTGRKYWSSSNLLLLLM